MNRIAVWMLTFWAIFTIGCGSREKIIADINDAQDARIGVMTGTTGERIAGARFPKAQIKSFDDIMDAVAALKSGQLDMIVTAYPTALQVSKKNPELRQLPKPLQNEESAIAIRKGEDELLSSVNRIIAELKANGTLASMRKRWFKPDFSPYEEVNIPVPEKGVPLKIGVSATREPLSFVDKNGRITGHDGELARWIGAKLQRPIEFSNMKFMALIPALQSKKIDLIISGMTGTAERKKTVNFSDTYFPNAQVMLVKKAGQAASHGVSSKITSLDDLKDKKVGVLLGSVYDTYVLQHYPQATIMQYKSPPDVLLGVKSGKADVGFYAKEMMAFILPSEPDLALLNVDSVLTLPIGMGFNRDNDSLREKFNTFLLELKKSGVYDDMVDRWMKKGLTVMPEIPNPKTNGTLIIGNVSDKGLPFTIVKDGKLIGFDNEMCERFAAYLGKDFKFADMEFGSLIASVATGKVDMVASTVMINEERKKRMDFSDPYYALNTCIFALKKNLAAGNAATEKQSASPSFLQGVITSFKSNILQENRYLLLWDGLKTTVLISILATIFGTLLGSLICFMRMSKRLFLNIPAKIYISILRGTPVLVLLMLIFYVVFASVDISPVLVAVIAFGLNFAAYVSEIFRSGIEGIDKGQSEAGIAMGFTKIKTFLFIIFPQTIPRILPVYKGEFISLVKMTSIVGYIAVQDLTKASDIIRSRTFDAFFPLIMVAILYFIISGILIQMLKYIERATDPKFRRRKVESV
jgi:polar amino acid transport system substrate-binding protein